MLGYFLQVPKLDKTKEHLRKLERPFTMYQVPESHIILINLFCTPSAASRIVAENPNVRFLFSDILNNLKIT